VDEAPPRLTYAEAGWERTVALPSVDDSFFKARLARWPDLAARSPAVLGGGLRSLHVRLGDDVVARLAVASGSDLVREAKVLRAMHGRVRVPRVVDAASDVLLLEFVPHEELPATADAGAAAGRAAALVHARTHPVAGFLGSDLEVASPMADPLGALREHLESALRGAAGRTLGPLAARVRATWDASVAALAAACRRPVLLHGDFKPANVKWLPRERDVLVLDWEFAWAGPALLDVGQMRRWGVPAEFDDAFARAYVAAGGSLPGDWRRTAEVLDLCNLVGLLDHPEPAPVRDADLLARIATTVGASVPGAPGPVSRS